MLLPKSYLRKAQGGTVGIEEYHIGHQARQKAIQHHVLQRRRRKTSHASASQQDWLSTMAIMSHVHEVLTIHSVYQLTGVASTLTCHGVSVSNRQHW